VAWTVVPNYVAPTYSKVAYKLVQLLAAAGWTIPASGDGIAVYSSSAGAPAVTHGAAGASGFGNQGAWVRLRAPGGAPIREFILQNYDPVNTTSLVIRYSSSGTGFVTGGNATTIPTAADGRLVSDGISVLFDFDLLYNTDFVIGGPDEDYSWALIARHYNSATFGRAHASVLSLDVMISPHEADTDPAVVHFVSFQGESAFNASTPWFGTEGNAEVGQSSGSYGWWRKGLSGERWVLYAPAQPTVNNTTHLLSRAYGPYTGRALYDAANRVTTFPMLIAKPGSGTGSPTGHKGVSRVFRMNSQVSAGSLLDSDRERLYAGVVNYPWDKTSKVRG